jgi:hypothetical protein
MHFYAGPPMHFLSGVDSSDFMRSPCHTELVAA